tara:strand:+ start:176 stop:1516 length:1341 start_codon:yes stop_codon:yes gene_type:complete
LSIINNKTFFKQKKIRIAFYTLGCKLNFSETSTISRDFIDEKYTKVDFSDYADIYVINTCSVTDNADKKFKLLVRKALKQNNDAFIAAIGCYAQLKPKELAKINGVDLVLSAKEKFKLIDYLNDISKNEYVQVHSCEIEEVDKYVSSFSLNDRTRAFLKVQDGCDYKCSYCTIPRARGISRSDSLSNVLNNAKFISKSGIKEIVLTGVNIGDYGKGENGNKSHSHTFLDLIKHLDCLSSIDRIRISSIEPNLLSNDIINFIGQSKIFLPHFHIPLQSGSDFILKKMRRRYLTSLYFEKIETIKAIMPNASIGVDVIVGFPGESDQEFLKTYNFLNSLPVSYLHVFSYSERPNTFASKMKNTIPVNVRKKRSKILRSLSAKKRRFFYESQLGNKTNILFETENRMGYIHGFSENYIKVRSPWNPSLINKVKEVVLDKIDNQGFVRCS